YLNAWGIPLPLIDPVIVKRSSNVRTEYGPGFKYEHYLKIKKIQNVMKFLGVIGGIFMSAQFRVTREMLLKILKSGDGPTEEDRKKSFFELTFLGETTSERVQTKVSGKDPGYDETSKMVSESAWVLIKNRESLLVRGGVTTTAACLGNPLIERLQQAGMKFEVISREKI
ncbi:MAG: saccharopine dehydrogenase, partial [SAR324 cluster bacterium]|nr:saccharopine dehydrogenase [SAR324 cluster bacterium]